MLPLDQYYFLLHAYDALGRHLFGTEWTGQEILQSRLDPPDVVEAQRAPFEQRLTEVDARDDEIQMTIHRITDEQQINQLEHESASLFSERAQLQQDLSQLPKSDDDYRRWYGAYARSEKVKALLFDALASETIKAQAGFGLLIDWPGWSRSRGFRCDLELSLIIVPRTISSKRRAAVLIRKQEFDAWLGTVLPEAPALVEQLGPDARCRTWLIRLTREHPERRPAKKSAMRADAIRLFGISGRGFDHLWTELAPPAWKEGGAPKGTRETIAPERKKRAVYQTRS